MKNHMARTRYNERQIADKMATEAEASGIAQSTLSEHLQVSDPHPQYNQSNNKIQSVNGKIGDVIVTKTDIGLSEVNNTSDANKPVSLATQSALSTKIDLSSIGVANGIASLDFNGKVPASQLPSYVDDIIEAANLSSFPVTGETGKIYIALDTNRSYRWTGSGYNQIIAGEVDTVNGKTGVVVLTSADIGLGNVDNTSDLAKPISTATQAALDDKLNATHGGSGGSSHAIVTTSMDGFMSATDKIKLDNQSGINTGDQTNITGNAGTATRLQTARTIAVTGAVAGSGSFNGSANLSIATTHVTSGVVAGTYPKVTVNSSGHVTAGSNLSLTDVTSALGYTPYNNTNPNNYINSAGAPVQSVNGRNGDVVVSKNDVGLSNVDNTSDALKPISIATQLEFENKVNVSTLGVPGGVATLDANGKVPAVQLPSFVDDIIEGDTVGDFPPVGEAGVLYVALDSGRIYRWSGSIYSAVNPGLVVSVNSKTGDVVLNKSDIGLANVDNTSDANKPISSLQQTAIDAARDTAIATAATDASTKASTAQSNAISASTPISHVGSSGSAHGIATTSVNGFMSSTDKTKLDGIAANANNYVHPSNHPASVITQDANNRFVTDTEKNTWNAKQSSLGFTPENSANKGQANGYASLDATGKIPSGQLPSYVDDVLEYNNLAAFPVTGEASKIYVALDTNIIYRWSGSGYVNMSAASGAVTSVAGRTGVVVLTSSDVGLGNVDNTSDLNKPISTATQNELGLKVPWSFVGAPNGVASLGTDGKVPYAQLPLTKVVYSIPSTSGSSLIPYDNTTPANTEGTQLLSQTLTPSGVNSKLLINGELMVDSSTNTRYLTLACFKDGVCIGALSKNIPTAGRPDVFPFSFYDPNFTASATYSIRIGANSATTWYVNRMATAVLNGMMANNRPVIFEETL